MKSIFLSATDFQTVSNTVFSLSPVTVWQDDALVGKTLVSLESEGKIAIWTQPGNGRIELPLTNEDWLALRYNGRRMTGAELVDPRPVRVLHGLLQGAEGVIIAKDGDACTLLVHPNGTNGLNRMMANCKEGVDFAFFGGRIAFGEFGFDIFTEPAYEVSPASVGASYAGQGTLGKGMYQ